MTALHSASRTLTALFAALTPHSPAAREVLNLGYISTFVFLLIFVAVVGAITYSLFRFRWREGDAEPNQIAGNKKVEIIWTVIPLVIVLLLFALTTRTMFKADPSAPPNPDLIVTGHQFWWEARYARSGAIVANEIHIPVGKPFAVRLDATDVIHEFWVPGLARKLQAIPGQPRFLELSASEEGTFTGICTEFCGVQHAWMRFVVVAESAEKFAAWEQAQLRPAPAPAAGAAAQGQELFVSMSCINCHAINGVPNATARVAPDLTHLASRRILGGGVTNNSAQALRLWLQNPQAVKPGVLMPNYNLTDEQLNQFGAYFQTLQ